MAPTGRYTPGATNNVGSGYWGNDFTAGSTFYITKDQGTTANIMGNWEIHGSKTTRSGDISTMFGTLPINVQLTPGAAWSDEWGLRSSHSAEQAVSKDKEHNQSGPDRDYRVRPGADVAQQKQQHNRGCL